ncbi:ABC transporter ATP-binding protein [Devosia sp.]|uniref:ABC transporter ATP-binding protein n=1 Tax=Devosia sp. TaxID=1871048 RepID=UPI002736CAAC|nr:ABC transporter ATP-binding protein [Devosia sp.]MDP2780599.1 ABC transporter ATP-binding protein [Devosia sp.]
MHEPLLSIEGLSASYGDFQALFGIDLTVNEGEVIAIIGANGAGKTTLMRAICGLVKRQATRAEFGGMPIIGLRPDMIAKSGIAMVPEGRQLFRSLSVEENLVIGAQASRKGPWTLEKIYTMFPVLKERRLTPATALSGGQQQMVAIGRALMSNPELLLFDEISLGLAPIIINAIYEQLPALVGGEMSAIIVEQDVARAVSVSDRVYCLQEGRVSLEGASGDVSRDAISKAYFGV